MTAITADALGAIDGVRHGFFTRQGGVSTGIYASANCGLGSGDDADAVLANRARAMAVLDLPTDSLVTMYQVHSAASVVVEAPWPREAAPRVDAMVSARPGIALGVLTADCAPILLAEPRARVIGAIHAGWRGALTGVIDTAIADMVKLGANPARVVAAIGPCIARPSYEVGPDFPAPFLAQDRAHARFFAPGRGGHHHFDLRGYAEAALRRLGVRRVEVSPHDTCADAERFFSYRRTCQRGERDYGRLLSAIALTP